MLQIARPPLARAPGGARPPAPGHPPARLRAEESEAGVQARGVRAVLRHARPHQAGRRQGRADRAGAHAAGRAGGRGSPSACRTSSTSMPTTTRRSPRPARATATSRVARRAAVRARRARRSGATIRAPADRARNTSTATAGSAERALRRRPATALTTPAVVRVPSDDARQLHAAHRGALLPVPGVALGTAAARIKNWQRDDVLLVVCEPGTRGGRRVHAEPLLRRAGHRLPRAPRRQHAPASTSARSSSTPATPTPAPASRASPTRARPARRSRSSLGCAPERGAAVLDRRHHGAAAGRARSSRRCRARAAPRAPTAGSPPRDAIMTTDTVPKGASRRVDDRRRAGHGHRHRQGRRHDPSRHGDDAGVRRDRRADRAARCSRRLAREVADVSFNCATVDGDTSTNDSFVHRGHRQGARLPPITTRERSAPRTPLRAAIEDVRDRARAGDRARRRGRDQVHRDPRRRRPRRRRMPARRVRASRTRRS